MATRKPKAEVVDQAPKEVAPEATPEESKGLTEYEGRPAKVTQLPDGILIIDF